MYQHACTMVYNWFLPSTLFPGILSFYCFLLFCTPGYLVWDFRWFSCLRLPVFRNTGFQHVHHIWLLHMFWGLELRLSALCGKCFYLMTHLLILLTFWHRVSRSCPGRPWVDDPFVITSLELGLHDCITGLTLFIISGVWQNRHKLKFTILAFFLEHS